jgi:hypothetical protein
MLTSLVLLSEDGKPEYISIAISFTFLFSCRSFHALDSKGRIHVWGAFMAISNQLSSKAAWNVGVLNGENPIMGDAFSAPGKSARTPLMLEIPATMRRIR